MVKVSVIIPIYNGEKYLKECLNSILKQSLEDIEIICIDDGSTDKTGSILEEYSTNDNRFKIITTENNGQGVARNTALKVIQGEYVAFIDSDDWIEINALELLYNRAKQDDLELLFFQMINYIQVSGKFISTDLYNFECFANNCIDENSVFNHNVTSNFLFEIPVGPVSKFYKKSFIESNNLKFPEGIFFEDNAFFYNAYFKCERAGFLKKQLYYRRRHNESVTQTFDESKFDIIKATNYVLDVFKDNAKYDSYKKGVVNHTFSMILEWFNKSPLYIRQEFYKRIKQDFKGFLELERDYENNLNEEFLLIYCSMRNNENYVDFLVEYKLDNVNYVIYDNGKEFDSNKYIKEHKYEISVVIPIYNNEKFIHRTLMSIENQTFGINNIEVLMVDDASTDNTYEVIKKYADKYESFKVIHINNGTGSPGTPRNIGLLESSSDYVIFLDHDDLFEINALDVLYESIISTDCDFVYGTYTSIDENRPTKIIYPNEFHGYFESISENERAIAFPPPSIWTKLFKRKFLIENNIFFPTILGEDAIFISKAFDKAKGINYLWDSIICYHNLNRKSYTNNISYKYLSEGFVSEDYLEDLYKKQGHENFYKIRGEGILDFYLSQFLKANLTHDEILGIFPALYNFVVRLNNLNLKPHTTENNKKLFVYILNNDLDSVLKLKQHNQPARGVKFKKLIKTLLKKLFR